MRTKYKEIFRLKKMLEKENIPFEFIDRMEDFRGIRDARIMRIELYQILYPNEDDLYISVIEGTYTFGGAVDLLEIMGGLTDSEIKRGNYKNRVDTHLSADTVFGRIKKHYEKESLKDGRNI